MTLVSGNIRCVRTFAGASLGGGLKWECGCRQRQFLAIWVVILLRKLQIYTQQCYYEHMLPLVGLWRIAKWMTYILGWFRNFFISARFTFRPFKVIQGHWFWCQSKARTVYATSYRSVIVTLMGPIFLHSRVFPLHQIAHVGPVGVNVSGYQYYSAAGNYFRTLVLSCTVSEIRQVLCAPDPTPIPYFGGVPVAPDRPCWASASARALSYSAVKLFSKYSE